MSIPGLALTGERQGKHTKTLSEIEAALGEPSLDVTHFGNGVLVGTVADDTGFFAVASDGTSTSYDECDSLAQARRATTRLAMSHVLNDAPVFG